ncbi:MAG: hypothetical protein RL748_269, partial [Pseudomonadota bacterium]
MVSARLNQGTIMAHLPQIKIP